LTPLRVLDGRSDIPQVVRRAVEEGRVGAVVSDTGRILAANDHYLRLVAFTREELETDGISWLRLTPAEWLSTDARAIGEARSRGRSAAFEKEYIRRDGSRIRVRLALVLIATEPFRLFAAVSAADDAEGARLVDALVEG
jgi:PAS domain S-box-containing protein